MSDVTGGTRQIGLPGDVDVPTDPASSMAEPMNEACDETTPRHPADNDFAPLAVSLEQWFESEEKFAELPEDVQKRIACGMGLSIPAALSPEEVQERIKRAEEFEISVTQLPDYVRERNALGQTLSIAAALWNVSSPRRRRSGAQHEDIMNHPGLAAERKALVEKSLQIDEWERTGLNIPIENKTPTDRKLQEEELRKLRNEETVLKPSFPLRGSIKPLTGLANCREIDPKRSHVI
jgi:hypothetical protein